MELVKQKEYILYLTEYKQDKLMNFYKGTYRGNYYFNTDYIFVDVIEIKSEPVNSGYVSVKRKDLMLFRKDIYTVHDIEKVKENGKQAIKNMEKRALDLVLKRLVNEHFEWF